MTPELALGDDEPPDRCQQYDCDHRPQQLVEIELASGDLEALWLCMIHTWDLCRRDSENVTVVGP